MSHEHESLPTPDELAFAGQWMEEVDRAARGELDPAALEALQAAARTNATLREALEDARALRPHFARMGALAASHRLDQRILGALDQDADHVSRSTTTHHRVRRNPGPRPFRAIPAWGWTAVAAAAVVLLVWTMPFGDHPPVGTNPVVARHYSDAEVQAAAAEMEMAMAMLGHTMQRTSVRLQEEMNSSVRQPLHDSFRQGFGRTLREIPYLTPPSDHEEHSGILIPPRDVLHRTLGDALPGERT